MPSSQVMKKWSEGKLHSGSKSGPKVHSRKQAIAILMSEKRNEAAHGGKYVHKSRHGSGEVELSGHNVIQRLDHHTVGEDAPNHMRAQGGMNQPFKDPSCKDENYVLDNPKKCGL